MRATNWSWLDHFAEGAWLTRSTAISRAGVLLAAELALFLFFVAGTHGLIVRLDHPTTCDFVSFYAAGDLVQSGTPELAYNQFAHYAAEQRATQPGIPYVYFYYPPVFLLLCRALAALPYMPAFVTFEAVTLGLFLLATRAILGERGWIWMLPVLAAPAVFWTIGLGQNSFLTAALFGAATLLVDRRPALAGVLFALLCYKPHFGLLVPLALAAGGRWRAFAAAAATVVALCAASLLLFGWETWRDYLVAFAGSHANYASGRAAKHAGLVTPYGAALQLGLGDGAGLMFQAVGTVAAAFVVGWTWWRNASLPVRSAALATATLIAIPLALFYDMMLSLVAIAWLVRAGRETGFLRWEKAAFVLVFVVPIYSLQVGMLHVPISLFARAEIAQPVRLQAALA